MGNGIGKLTPCFSGDVGEVSRRRNDIAVYLSDPLDEGLGHSFCYNPPDPLPKIQSSDDPSAAAAAAAPAYRAISGASISANTTTAPSTAYTASIDKASAFESSDFFSSIPLQPIPRNSISTVKSGPILRYSGPISGQIERGFLSGPIERSFISGPIENHYDKDKLQRYKPKSTKWDFVKNFKKVISRNFWGFSKEFQINQNQDHEHQINNHRDQIPSISSGNSSTITSNNLSTDMSLIDENDVVGDESFGSQKNLQWAQGKAGEDRVHVVISEEHGWVFVGIYDGFNGPDATDFLLTNLYPNVFKELKGLLWCDDNKVDSCENPVNGSFISNSLDSKERVELKRKLRERLSNLGPDGVGGLSVNNVNVNHLGVMKALSEALRKTEISYLEVSDMMLVENPVIQNSFCCSYVLDVKKNRSVGSNSSEHSCLDYKSQSC